MENLSSENPSLNKSFKKYVIWNYCKSILMIAYVRKPFDEIPAVVLAFPHSKRRKKLNPLPVILKTLKVVFLRGWFKGTEPASLPQTNPNKKKIYRCPRSLGEVPHEGENKEAREELIFLNTDRKIREKGSGFEVMCSYAAFLSTSHTWQPLETYLCWITNTHTNICSDISYQEV